MEVAGCGARLHWGSGRERRGLGEGERIENENNSVILPKVCVSETLGRWIHI